MAEDKTSRQSSKDEDKDYIRSMNTTSNESRRSQGRGNSSSQLGLNLSFVEGKGFRDSERQYVKNMVQEREILVTFELPDGSYIEHDFKLGQTIEFLKSHIEIEVGMPMMQQLFYVDDELMIDPLCLLDYDKAIVDNQLFIRVDGPLPNESKK